MELDPYRLRDPRADTWAEILKQERAWQLERAVASFIPACEL
jgi:hypothetical protein